MTDYLTAHFRQLERVTFVCTRQVRLLRPAECNTFWPGQGVSEQLVFSFLGNLEQGVFDWVSFEI
jgi:hypothetical protein